jgi:gamma-glutamyltranspeptidase/glutathione hydrolase
MAAMLVTGVPVSQAQRAIETDGAVGLEPKALVTARRHMIVAANPHATEAGLAVLRAGGSATDAAIAAQFVLNLVEPQSSGIGGGGFLVHWNASAKRFTSYDGRETAPRKIQPNVFLMPDGRPRGFWEVLNSGESVGVPGLVAMLARAHAAHGKIAWRELFQPAIKLAESGFAVSKRLNGLLAERGAENFSTTARGYFFDTSGKPRAVGEKLANPAYAKVLRRIAEEGPVALYKGEVAQSIVDAVASGGHGRPGTLSADDLAEYSAVERPVVCGGYRRYRICGMAPPSSGGLATVMTLGLLAPHSVGVTPMRPDAVHLITQAQRLAYADRDRWVADPDRVKVPAGLTAPEYLSGRGRLILPGKAPDRAEPGLPPGTTQRRAGNDATTEIAGTTHLSVVDAAGNAVALTSTIEAGFGSGLMAEGFLLNNQLTDFSFRTHDADGRPIANAPEAGKRPRSSMAPTIVLDPSGRLFAVLGSPGGSRIPLYVMKSLIGLIDWKLDAQSAADLPNFGSRNGPLEIEKDVAGALLPLQMKALGHDVRMDPMTSGTHIIVVRPGRRLEGGADPRREGLALGD